MENRAMYVPILPLSARDKWTTLVSGLAFAFYPALAVWFTQYSISTVAVCVAITLTGTFSWADMVLQKPKWWYAHSAVICLCFAVVITIFSYPFFIFLESGMGSGPYYGKAFNGGVAGLVVSQRVEYGSGTLAVYNRAQDEAPVLAYFDRNERLVWAHELVREDTAPFLPVTIHEIRGYFLRDRIVLTGDSGGVLLYIWKWNRVHRFWFAF